MKHYKEETHNILYKTTCDLCGNIIITGVFTDSEVEIKYRKGVFGGEEISFDICGKCFEDQIIPWFIDNKHN